MAPVRKRFMLFARISSDNPSSIGPVLEKALAGHGTAKPVEGGFEVSGEFEGESAKDLNRALLSEMRRAVKKTRIRAEWSSGSEVERFFDYVQKGSKKAPAR